MHNYEAGLNALADVARSLRQAGITSEDTAALQWSTFAPPHAHLQSRAAVDRVGDFMGWAPGYLNNAGTLYYRSGATFQAFAGADR